MLTQQEKHNLKTNFVHSTHASPRYQSGFFSPSRGNKKSFNRNRSSTTQGPWCIGPRGMPNETYFTMKACKFNRHTDHTHTHYDLPVFVPYLWAQVNKRCADERFNNQLPSNHQQSIGPSKCSCPASCWDDVFLVKKRPLSKPHEIRTRGRMGQKPWW